MGNFEGIARACENVTEGAKLMVRVLESCLRIARESIIRKINVFPNAVENLRPRFGKQF